MAKKQSKFKPLSMKKTIESIESQFVREIEIGQNKMAKTNDMAIEMVREIERHQQKNTEKDAFSAEFVREIEKKQEQILKLFHLNREFIREVENNQDKLSIARKEIKRKIEDIRIIQKNFSKLIVSKNLEEVDELVKKLQLSLDITINDLQKTYIKVI